MTDSLSRRGFVTSVVAAGAAGAFGFSRPGLAADDAITQTASFKINPEKEDEAIAFLEELTAAVEEKEPGVLAYIAHRSSQDPTQVFFYEVYANEEAMAAHGQQPHLLKLREAFGAGVFQPPVEVVRMNKVGGYWR